MKVCFLRLLTLLLSLAALCTAVPSAWADNGGALDFSVPDADVPVTVSVAPATTETLPPSVPELPTPATPQSPAVSFELSVDPVAAVPRSESTDSTAPKPGTTEADDLFAGGSDSLVARTVGHAEGTRTADGHRTRAYYGHVDPGNGVWNQGSFSYQHPSTSPEDADDKQLERLKRQRETLRQKAVAAQLQLSRAEELNAIDLANQAPLAALDTPGYVEWLAKAHKRGLTEADAILWARTQSYWNPRQQRWEAPGLGNTEASISHDQERRQTAIARALDAYEQQTQSSPPEVEPTVKVAANPPKLLAPLADRTAFPSLSQPQPHDIASGNINAAP